MYPESPLLKLKQDPRSVALLNALGDRYDLHIVGGAIRDTLMGLPYKDIDYATGKAPLEIKEQLEKAGMRVIPTGLSHQTVTVKIFEDLPHVEITSFRSKGMNPEGGLHLGKTIQEDLQLRDFTINSLALPLNGSDPGEPQLIDPAGGCSDIQNKMIRATGNAEERFREDPLRILRMIRFAGQLGFEIDKETKKAALLLSPSLYLTSIERIREEFIGIISSQHVRRAFSYLEEIEFFSKLIPEIETCRGFEQNKFHKHDVYQHTLDVLEYIEPTPLLRMSALLHDVGKPPSLGVDNSGERHFYLHEKIGADMTINILERFKFGWDFINMVEKLVRTHMRPLDAGDGGLRRILRDTDPHFAEWRALKYSDMLAVMEHDLDNFHEQFKIFDDRIEKINTAAQSKPFRELAIGGRDLIKLGFKPGPIFKEILEYLNENVIDNPSLNQPEILISMVKAKF